MTQSLIQELIAQPVRWRTRAMIAASAASTAALLLAVAPGRVGYDNGLVLADLPAARIGQLTLVPGPAPDDFHAVGMNEVIDLAVDRRGSMIGVRCWFGGVHRVESVPGGCVVTYTVHFLKPGHERLASGIEARMAGGLLRVLEVIADRLAMADGSVRILTDADTHPEVI
jgi:hypothetical protein